MLNKEVEVDDKPLLLQKFFYFLLFIDLTPECLGVD